MNAGTAVATQVINGCTCRTGLQAGITNDYMSQTNIPINISQVGGGTMAAHSAAMAGNPIPVAARVNSTLDTTLVNNDSSYLCSTTAQQLMIKQFATSENDWQFACATGGIVNTTTGVTVKAAGAASIRNYMTGLTLYADALGAATEVIVYDGTTATVLWRHKIPVGGLLGGLSIQFSTPLRGTAATLMGVATVTATVTGGVIFSCQGYQSF